MPGGTTTANAAPKAGADPKSAPALPTVPFTRAAKEHIEPFVDVSQQITANSVVLGPYDVPAYGYLRSIVLLVQATGGVSAVATAAQEDAPFSALADVQLADVNGAPIFGPLTGYDLYLSNKYGGYEFSSDPKQTFSYGAVVVGAAASGNFSFSLQIPVELNVRDALGSLANQNASSTYKLKLTLANSAAIYSTAPNTTLPTVRIRAFLKAWTQPPATDLRGHPQATAPPAHGTSQYWSKFSPTVASGSNTIRFARVGNYIREIILVQRRTASTRANGESDFPDPAQYFWDTRLLHNYTKAVFRDELGRRTGFSGAAEAAGGYDNGVFPYDWCHEFDGKLGRELRDGWLPTVQSTRLEVQGNWANAGTLDVITNDVAPAGEVFI
jgi:hypothetical protein